MSAATDEPVDEVLARFQPSRPGEVHDRAEVKRIRARIDYARLPWYERLVTRAPEGWRDQAKGPVAS